MANSDDTKVAKRAVSADGRASTLRTDTDRRRLIEKIRQDNENEYRPRARRWVRASLSASHPYPWTYVYELTQNALDAGADRVSWQLTDNGVRFQHDGSTALDESHVRGISSLGMSTKGLANVGFMGLGFKSVFARFRTVHVSGFGFRFRFEIHTTKGDLGQQIIEWFDSLLPLWDAEHDNDPDSGYTTSFSLERPVVPTETLANDLERISSPDDPAPLAVLALRGLKQVRVDNFQWDLEVDENGSVIVNRRSSDDERTSWRWQSFVSRYRPDDGAMGRFLEVRQQLHEHVDDDGQRIDREVVGLLPLDGDGLPNPSTHGNVYATLPTQEQIPFGFHLQADWFVDVDRQNLRDVKGDAWQELIVSQVPDIVRQFLVWLKAQSEPARKLGYPALRDPRTDDGILSKPFQALHDHLVDTLADESVVPIHGVGSRRFRTPDGVARLPGRFGVDYGRHPEWRPDLLFDRDLMDEELLSTSATKFFTWLGCGRDIGRHTVPWPDKLAHWWNALPEDTRTDALFALWHGVKDRDWLDAPVVPTEAGPWVQMSEIRWLNEAAPTEKQPGGAVVAELLADSLPSADRRVPPKLRRVVENSQHDGALCFERHRTDVRLSSLVQQALSNAEGDHDLRLVALLEWALSRGAERGDLVPWVLTEQGARKPSDALLADPVVEGALYRRKICPDKPALVKDYASVDDYAAVVRFLERIGVCAGDPLREIKTSLSRFSKREVAGMLGVSRDNVMEANKDGYTVIDHGFSFRLDDVDLDALQTGLTRGLSFLKGKGRRNARSQYHGRLFTPGGHGTAAWVGALKSHPWLPCDDGQRRKPAEVLLHPDPDFEDAPIGSIDPALAERLQEEGVQFGSDVQKSPTLRRLSRRGADQLADSELAKLLREACDEVDHDHTTEAELLEALNDVRLHGVPLTRVVQQTGAGPGHRSDLGGWVVALEGVEQSLSAAVKELPLTIPVTTTGRQALDFLLHIWNEKPQRVDTIRGSIAAAYRYVLDDRNSGDLPENEWLEAREQVYLYGQNSWHALSPNLVVADVQSPRIHRFLPEGRVIVAAAHLGDSDDQVGRVARCLGLGLLSEDVKVIPGRRVNGPACVARIRKLVGALSLLEDRRELRDISFHDKIVLQVDGIGHRINAYVADGTLLLVGEPRIFAADAAQQIVEHFRLSQRGNVVPYLTTALSNLDHEHDFRDNLEIMADELGVDVPEDAPAQAPLEAGTPAEDTEMAGRPANDDDGQHETDQDESDRRVDETQTRDTDEDGSAGGTAGRGDGTRRSGSGHNRRGDGNSAAGRSTGDRESTARTTSGSTSRRGAADHFGIVVERGSGHERESPDDQSHTTEESRWDDHKAREAVLEYERSRGRSARSMPDDHPGYDVESVDSTPGLESPIVRRIEVKGVRGIFDREASVVLSSRQVHDAINHQGGDLEYWLYVVDSTESARPRVFPIPWTRYRASLKYGFYARVWAATAEQPTGST